MTKSNKTSTPEYLEWEAKLTDLLTIISDKHHPWQYIDSSQDSIIKISKFSEEKDAKCPICKDVYTHLGMWGDWS
ncbi:5821_t:CDS:2, partial [Racocetra fulgida]